MKKILYLILFVPLNCLKIKDMDAIKLKEFKESWNDKSSSMNNICAKAWKIADSLRIQEQKQC